MKRYNYRLFDEDPPAIDFENPAVKEFVTKAVEAEAAKHKDNVTKIQKEFEMVKSKATMTAKERQEMEDRLKDVNTQYQTEKVSLERELGTTRETLKKRETELSTERDSWKNRFSESTIIGSLTDAAATNDAYAPEQIVAILGRDSKLVEITEDGKPSGRFEVKVKFKDVDPKDPKKLVDVEMTPKEVVARMRELPNYSNLFKAKAVGGVGGSNNGGGKVSQTDLTKILREKGMDAYLEATRKPAKKD